MNRAKNLKVLLSTSMLAAAMVLIVGACGGGPAEQSTRPDQQQESGEPQAASADIPSPDEACEAFEGVGGFGGLPGGFANFASSVQGGPSVEAQYSTSPSSDEARQIAEFFEGALVDALGSGVEARCYWEVTTSQEGESGRGLWISLELPEGISSDAGQKIQNSLSARGASVGGFFSNPSGGESSVMIIVNELPLDLDGGAGGMLMITEEYAVIIAGQGTGSGAGN